MSAVSEQLASIMKARGICSGPELARRIEKPESTVRGWLKSNMVPAYSQILEMRQRLPLELPEYTGLVSACHADLIEQWKAKAQ